ncbi:MAG TPA: FtsX-like permease family protein, partial [Rhodothermales bacterium]|nr:FtsX-like permease family protein [Rhodothermales bacterium]
SAARTLGLQTPVGTVLRWGNYAGPVVGVVRDFHFASLHHEIEPLVIPLRPGVGSHLLVRVQAGQAPAAVANIRAVLTRLAPDEPFRYTFLDDSFERLYAAEARLGNVFTTFSVLAIVIACLGLFGLAAYAAEQRRKEVGIRKVLGASTRSLVGLLSKDFLRLVGVAFVVATPLAYLAMGRWLEGFAYRIELGPGAFVLAGGLALLIALATVSTQALRAASADPTKSLRTD